VEVGHLGSENFLALVILPGEMQLLGISSHSSTSLSARPPDYTILLEHDTIICMLLDYWESPVLSDVIDSMTLAIENNNYISGIHHLEHKGEIIIWKWEKEVGAGQEEKKSRWREEKPEAGRGRKRMRQNI